jgi:hypothetical protein
MNHIKPESYSSDHVRELVSKMKYHGYESIKDEIRSIYGTGSYLNHLPAINYYCIGCSV